MSIATNEITEQAVILENENTPQIRAERAIQKRTVALNQKKIRDILNEQGGAGGVADVVKKTGANRKTVGGIFSSMVENGSLRKIGHGKYTTAKATVEEKKNLPEKVVEKLDEPMVDSMPLVSLVLDQNMSLKALASLMSTAGYRLELSMKKIDE